MIEVKVLKELMKEKGIKSIKELSLQTGLPYTTIYYMLSGHDTLLSTAVIVSKFFNVPVDYILKKYYGISTYSEEEEIHTNTSSILEATLLNMM